MIIDQSLGIVITFMLALLFIGVVGLFFIITRGFWSINYYIKQSIIPRSLTLEPQARDIADLAIELWRLEKRLVKIEDKLSIDENKSLCNSVDKIRRFVQKNDIEIADYTGQVYNEGMNLDILSSEKDPGLKLKKSIIYETHEPAVSHKGVLIRKAKVIIREK